MAHNFDAHVGGAARHRVGQPRRISVAIVQCPRACYDAVNIIKGIEFFDLCRIDDLHVETDVVSDALHVMEPVDIGLLTRDTDATRRMPTHILAGLFFQSWIQSITVVVDFREIVVADQAGALAGSMPSRSGGQFSLLDQHNIGFAFFGEVVSQRHPHNAATNNDNPGLRIHGHTLFSCSTAVEATV